MNRDEFITKYWKYYRMLEKEFASTLDYVELESQNHNCFLNRYGMLIQAIGGELDNFFKMFCGIPNNTDKYPTIADYVGPVLSAWPDIREQKVEVVDKKIHL
jgi:hypothetical protein